LNTSCNSCVLIPHPGLAKPTHCPASAAALQVDQWIDTSSQLVSGQQFEALCGRLSDYLSLRSYFVGYGVTAADLAIWGQLQGEDC
jgi:glutamyl-tRNA synthetase